MKYQRQIVGRATALWCRTDEAIRLMSGAFVKVRRDLHVETVGWLPLAKSHRMVNRASVGLTKSKITRGRCAHELFGWLPN